MAKNEEQKMFWVWAQLEEELHTAMLEIATTTGKHPKILIEMAIEDFVVNWVETHQKDGKYVPSGVKIEAIVLRDRRRQIMLTQIKQLAYNHVKSPTDDTAEELQQACDLAGISIEAILEEVGNKPHIIEMVAEHGNLNDVETFLVEALVPGEMYSARDIVDAAAASGFKKYMVNEAKRKLGIRSLRKSEGWYWYLAPPAQHPEEEEQVF